MSLNQPLPAFVKNNLTETSALLIAASTFMYGSAINYSCKCGEAVLEYQNSSAIAYGANFTKCYGSLGWNQSDDSPRCRKLGDFYTQESIYMRQTNSNNDFSLSTDEVVTLSSGEIFIIPAPNTFMSVFDGSSACNEHDNAGLVRVYTPDDLKLLEKFLELLCYEGAVPLANNIL